MRKLIYTLSLLTIILLPLNLLVAQSKGMGKLEKGFAPVGTERRLALIIGNKDYEHVSKLKNPLNDAKDMSDALKQLGFDVLVVSNANYRDFMVSINKFKTGMNNSDVVFFYYSGHGVGYGGQSYLLPVDADISCLDEVDSQGISLNRLIGEINAKKVKNSFIVLDACRNLPNLQICDNTKKDLSIGNGLIRPNNNPRGSVIVYATKEGQTADDNVEARNGLFTSCFLRYLTKPDWSIRKILDKTSIDVSQESQEHQVPGRYEEIFGDFYFALSGKPISETEVAKDEPKPKAPTHTVVDEPKSSPVKKPDLLPYEPDIVFVEGGTFEMGRKGDWGIESNESPIHNVSLSDFYIGRYEITQAQWKAIMGNNPSHFSNCDNCPVESVNWNDVQVYLSKLNKLTGKKYRLPTEAEWEYAAKGGKESDGFFYSGSHNVYKIGWVYSVLGQDSEDSKYKSHEVGGKKANELGLFDMTGNVLEWCNDWYENYTSSGQTNPKGPTAGTFRVCRGGSWASYPNHCSVTSRDLIVPENRVNRIGFRVALPIN